MGTILRIALQFGEHVEVPTMGSQKYVAGQSTQHRKGMLEILNDAGVAYGMAGCKVVLRLKNRPSNDDDIPYCFRWLSWKVLAVVSIIRDRSWKREVTPNEDALLPPIRFIEQLAALLAAKMLDLFVALDFDFDSGLSHSCEGTTGMGQPVHGQTCVSLVTIWNQ